jgi:hypothetical protein
MPWRGTFIGQGRFVDIRRGNLERDAQARQQFAPVGGARPENQAGRVSEDILLTESREAEAVVSGVQLVYFDRFGFFNV